MLEIKTKAPAFKLKNQDGEIVSLKDSGETWKVIYFYPKDDTPGCTKEACAIAEVYSDFKKLGVVVYGVSKDTPASHLKFKAKYNLPFTLLSDETGEMIAAYGALVQKSMFGKKYLGIDRITYIINPKGMIAKVYPKVAPTEHALEMLADLRVMLKA
jgi:thioredoxin-dependent peroxiredoxin